MIRKLIIPLLAIAGLAMAINTVRTTAQVRPPNPPVAEPAKSPFKYSIAGSGIIESSSENIAVGTGIAGIVTEVFVKPGDTIKKGDPLFSIDSRTLTSEVAVRTAALAQAQNKLAQLRARPRPEEIPPVEAKLAEFRALLNDARTQLELFQRVKDDRAISQDDMLRRTNAAATAQTRVAQAEAELALIKAGAWAPDIAIAQADVAAAQSQVNSTKIEIERLTVRAPIDGQVLQRNVRVGEWANAGTATSSPLMMVGNTDLLHIRCDIDENDAWRLNKAGSKARASLRGNGDIFTDVSFVRFEPFVIPKRSLTGESTERVDTRVLQVLFSFPKAAMNAYVGQLVDVRIEADPAEGRTAN